MTLQHKHQNCGEGQTQAGTPSSAPRPTNADLGTLKDIMCLIIMVQTALLWAGEQLSCCMVYR